jgi:hypothetical protein
MNKSHQTEDLKFPLAVDASSTRIQVGIPGAMDWVHLETVELPALEGLFQAISRLVDKTGINLGEVDELFFCEGPGSTLGLRITAAFAKTLLWEGRGKISLYSYNALDLASQMIGRPPLHLQAPFRKGWRFVRTQMDGSAIGSKNLHESKEALSLFPESHHLPDPRSIGEAIDSAKIIDYDLDRTKGLKDLRAVAEPADTPVVYSPVPPTFKKWEPARSPVDKE